MGIDPLNEFDRMNNMLNHDPIDRPPVICPMHTATVALMKASNAFYPEIQDDPIKMARLARAAYEIAGFENARVPFDETVEVSAYGTITGRKGMTRHPLVMQRAITKLEDVDRLHIPDPRTEGKVPVVLEAVRLLEEDSSEVPVFLGIISPLMLAMQLRGDHETMLDMVNDPEILKELLGKTTDFIMEYAREGVESGVDQLVLDDSLSNSDFLTLEQFRAFAEPYEDRVANEMRKMDVESILHVCGNVSEAQLDRMIEIDVDAISIDEAVPITVAKQIAARRHMVVLGNISPTKTLLMGKVGSIEEATKRCIDDGVDAVAPGCNLETHTPLENLLAMTGTAKSYGAKKAKESR
jgi:[methyl-Co(III) methylamine-specific corrinoid protein]:coenzyme M methyltransferase